MFGTKWQEGAQRWFLYAIAVAVAIGGVVTLAFVSFAK